MKANITIQSKVFTEFPNLNRNDYGWDITFNIKDEAGDPFNLTGLNVNFKTKLTTGDESKIDGACVITNYTSGICTYTLNTSDIDTAGKYTAELEASSDTVIYTVPLGNLVVVEDIP